MAGLPNKDFVSPMKIEMRSTAAVIPYAGNPRKNDSAIDKVARSIKEFGFQQPIVVDPDGVVVAGHSRLEAAKRLKLKQVPIVVIRGKTAVQISAYRLMDNRSHEESLWDEDALVKEIEALSAGARSLTGFEDGELARLLGQIDLPSIAEPPQSVVDNVARLAEVKAQRAKGNAGVISKSDTEHYLVVVFPSRIAREEAVKRLGLPADERYVDASAIELRQRIGGQREIRVHAERANAAAKPNKAGATG
jgi:ParB-like chromosome segregation protein Spo0J